MWVQYESFKLLTHVNVKINIFCNDVNGSSAKVVSNGALMDRSFINESIKKNSIDHLLRYNKRRTFQ